MASPPASAASPSAGAGSPGSALPTLHVHGVNRTAANKFAKKSSGTGPAPTFVDASWPIKDEHEVALFWELKQLYWPSGQPDYKTLALYWNQRVSVEAKKGTKPCPTFKSPQHLKEFADSQADAVLKLQAQQAMGSSVAAAGQKRGLTAPVHQGPAKLAKLAPWHLPGRAAMNPGTGKGGKGVGKTCGLCWVYGNGGQGARVPSKGHKCPHADKAPLTKDQKDQASKRQQEWARNKSS